MVKTLSQLYLDARRALLAHEDAQTAGMMARNLLCRFSGLTQEEILANPGRYMNDRLTHQMDDAVERLLKDEPLAYVLGEWDFYGMTLQVSPSVLIPRDDTCAVTELAIHQALFLDQDPRILDLCTGSGCIGLAIASRVKDARVTLADLSREALAVAKKNASACNLSGRVSCVQADAMKPAAPFLGKFDMIVSNPPYVTGAEMEQLPRSVKAYEPHMALYGGEDGLDFYRSIAKNFVPALKPGGLLCLEFGMGQGDAVCGILTDVGGEILERKKDYQDRERAVLARFGRKED